MKEYMDGEDHGQGHMWEEMVCPTSWRSREAGDRTVEGSKLILKIVMESKKDAYLSSPDPVHVIPQKEGIITSPPRWRKINKQKGFQSQRRK